MQDKTEAFTRDPFTWLTYLMLGVYSYLLNGLGPIMPFLREELDLSYSWGSLHFSAFAVGMLLAGLGGDRVIKILGRQRAFWRGGLGIAGGIFLLLIGTHPILTIGGAWLMGTVGSLLLIIIPAALSDRYGAHRAIALSEANVVASLCGGLAPVAIGFFERLELGWRGAVGGILLFAFLLWILFRHVPFPESRVPTCSTMTSSTKLPLIYWIYWSILVLAVSVEFCVIFWSSTFLEIERGLAKANAALMMSFFLEAMVVGRLIGSRLSRSMQSETIILGSVSMCFGGFLLHWWATSILFSVIGLFLAGIGVANLYPQILALAVGAAGPKTDAASARTSLASGMAILLLPLLLGGLADHVGLWNAYGLVAGLLLFIGAGIGFLRSPRVMKLISIEP